MSAKHPRAAPEAGPLPVGRPHPDLVGRPSEPVEGQSSTGSYGIPPRSARGEPIVLVGAPGAGKSTVGALLAERLAAEFTDADAVIEERAGKSIAEIFADDGEAAFRQLEEETTAALLRRRGVLALGGGAVLSAATRKALQGHRVVWLRVGLPAALHRIGLDTARPLLLGNVRGRLIKQLGERKPLYDEVAEARVDTDDASPEDVVESIMRIWPSAE
jgi:shikimate kinase